MKSLKLTAIALTIAGLLIGCGETFTGIYHGEMQVTNQRGCFGSRPGRPDVQVSARIDGDEVTLRLYSDEKPSIQDIEKIEAHFTDSLNFEINNVSEEYQDQFWLTGHGDFSQDRHYMSLSLQITKPIFDPVTNAPSESQFCQETYRIQQAQLAE